ncbi:hypothetical protein CHS0354_011349, partial [Potamilus streckersoni]
MDQVELRIVRRHKKQVCQMNYVRMEGAPSASSCRQRIVTSKKPIVQKIPSNSDASGPGDKNDTGEYRPPTSALEKTLQKIEANIINEKQQIKKNTSSFEDTDSLEFTNIPICHGKPKATLSCSKSHVPEYNPTPLQELKKRKTKLFSVGKSKYELALLEGPNSEQEYDPACNYSTHTVPSYARPLIRTKRNYSFEGELEPASKKSRFSADNKLLTAQFSDDDMPSEEENLGQGSNEMTNDDGSETDDDGDHDDSWPDLSDDDFKEEVNKEEVNDSNDTKTNTCDLPLPLEFTPEGFVKVPSNSDSGSKSCKNKQNERNKDTKGKFPKEKPKESKDSKISESGDSVKNSSERGEKGKAVRHSIDTKHRNQERLTSSEKNGESRDIKKSSFSDKNGDSGDIKLSSSQIYKDQSSKSHSDKHRENNKGKKEKEHLGNSSSKVSERRLSDNKEHPHSNLSKEDKVREKSKSHSKDNKCNSNGSHEKDKKSLKSAKKPVKQRSIVDLNVDLFGNDSDTEENKTVLKTDQSELYSRTHSNSSDIQEIQLLDDFSDTDTYEECLKIFNEHKPIPKKVSSVHTGDSKKSSDPGIPTVNSKKRIAHKNSDE